MFFCLLIDTLFARIRDHSLAVDHVGSSGDADASSRRDLLEKHRQSLLGVGQAAQSGRQDHADAVAGRTRQADDTRQSHRGRHSLARSDSQSTRDLCAASGSE